MHLRMHHVEGTRAENFANLASRKFVPSALRAISGIMRGMTPDDERTIGDCLRAAVDGPFFPDSEFHTLIGLNRGEVAAVLADWPGTSNAADQALAVNNVLNNLLGYPHRVTKGTWHSFIDASPREVAKVLARWRSDGDLDPGARATSSR